MSHTFKVSRYRVQLNEQVPRQVPLPPYSPCSAWHVTAEVPTAPQQSQPCLTNMVVIAHLLPQHVLAPEPPQQPPVAVPR